MAGIAPSPSWVGLGPLLERSGWPLAERGRLPATTLLPRACPSPAGNAFRLCADRKLYATVELGPGPVEPAPFSYAFSGGRTWFRDQRWPGLTRPVAGFHTRAALVELLEHDAGAALAALADEEIATWLHPHQAEACAALEAAARTGSRRILIAAAPGAGKTQIGVEAIRRLVGAGVARRALYLVGSPLLVEPVAAAFA
jgi:type I site-specific restriction endonuclease